MARVTIVASEKWPHYCTFCGHDVLNRVKRCWLSCDRCLATWVDPECKDEAESAGVIKG